jgi:hypothetical protein
VAPALQARRVPEGLGSAMAFIPYGASPDHVGWGIGLHSKAISRGGGEWLARE